MNHDELLAKVNKLEEDAVGDVWLIHNDRCCGNCTCDKEEKEVTSIHKALRAVVEFHKPTAEPVFTSDLECRVCDSSYPCPTIQAIEKELG